MAVTPRWRAAIRLQREMQATIADSVEGAARAIAREELDHAGIEPLPVNDQPRPPEVPTDRNALLLLLKHIREHAAAEVVQAIDGDSLLTAWREEYTPDPGDPA